MDDAEKSSVMEKKIRVVFLTPADEGLGAAVTPSRKLNGVSSESESCQSLS